MRTKLLLALLSVSFVQVQKAAEEVEEIKEEHQVALHPTHTAHNVLHGMIDTVGFTPDLIRIVDEYVGLFYESSDQQQSDQEHKCCVCAINLCNGDSSRLSKDASRFIGGPGRTNGFHITGGHLNKRYCRYRTPNIVVTRQNAQPIAWASDDTFVFGEENTIKLVEADTGIIKKEIQTPDAVSFLSVLSPNLIASASSNKSAVFIHHLDNGELLDKLDPKNKRLVKKLRKLRDGSISIIYDDDRVITYANRELLTGLLTHQNREQLQQEALAKNRHRRQQRKTGMLLAGWGAGAVVVAVKLLFGDK